MSLHKLDIRDGNVYWNEEPQGKFTTSPPEGIRAQASVSTENQISFVRLQWKIKKPPQPTAPLELLSLEMKDFFPNAMFVAGRRYESNGSVRLQEPEKGFPYNTYYKFHIFPPPPYDAALHAKMPLVCWQRDNCAFAVLFPKFVRLSNKHWPLCLQASGTGSQVSLRVAMPDRFRIQRKPYGWFGTRSEMQTHHLNLSNVQLIEVTFGFLMGDNWKDCIQAGADWLHKPDEQQEGLSCGERTDFLEKCLHFYDRTWDSRNRTHVHLPIKNVPAFESVEFKYSHVTDDLTKLVLYRRLIDAGWKELRARERELLQKILSGAYSYQADGATLWHTTTYFNGKDLDAFSHHGVGFVGFPGGMATNVRRLYEYFALSANKDVAKLADEDAEWLRNVQRKDGSWPAVIRDDEQKEAGCVASTAESARALLAGYYAAQKHEYLETVRKALQYVNRPESFFECRQYLRDVNAAESDGISGEACINANLDFFGVTAEKGCLDNAEKWGSYVLQWVRPFFLERQEGPSFDGLSQSITPRVDVWGGLLAARALMRLGQVGGKQEWMGHAWRLVSGIIKLHERDGGLSETWFFDFPNGFESIHIEPTFVADALVEFLLDAPNGEDTLSAELSNRKLLVEKRFPALRPIAPIQNLVTLSKTRPEFIVNRNIRMPVVFSGLSSGKNRLRRLLYQALRSKAFRKLARALPAAKILTNRYCVQSPVKNLRRADKMKMKTVRYESFIAGSQRYIYQTDFHTIVLSLLGAGNNEENLPANDIGFEIEANAGDLNVEQVRIDLDGNYKVQSVMDKEILLSTGGIPLRLRIRDGQFDGFLREEERLALDISLSANWNFFGKYRLSMRIERTH